MIIIYLCTHFNIFVTILIIFNDYQISLYPVHFSVHHIYECRCSSQILKVDVPENDEDDDIDSNDNDYENDNDESEVEG